MSDYITKNIFNGTFISYRYSKFMIVCCKCLTKLPHLQLPSLLYLTIQLKKLSRFDTTAKATWDINSVYYPSFLGKVVGEIKHPLLLMVAYF